MPDSAALLDAAATKEQCDFFLEVAAELPMQATASLMGVPLADRHDLMSWSNATLDHAGRELGESSDIAIEAAAAMAAYGSELMRTKRTTESRDVLGMVAHGRVVGADGTEEPLSEMEQLMFFSLLSFAGSETTRNAIALGVAALAEHPGQMRLLRSRPVCRGLGDRGDPAVEQPHPLQPANRHARHGATRAADRHGGQGHRVVGFCEPGRIGVLRSVPFRRVARSEPTSCDSVTAATSVSAPHLPGSRSASCSRSSSSASTRSSSPDPIERFRTNKHAGVSRHAGPALAHQSGSGLERQNLGRQHLELGPGVAERERSVRGRTWRNPLSTNLSRMPLIPADPRRNDACRIDAGLPRLKKARNRSGISPNV